MRIRWWQSIRWQLALGSTLVALLATGLLALTALLAIISYYSIEQKNSLDTTAISDAHDMSVAYTQYGTFQQALLQSNSITTEQKIQYYILVFNNKDKVVYAPGTLITRTPILHTLTLALHNPNTSYPSVNGLRNAIIEAQSNRQVESQIGPSRPVARPFIAVPITAGLNNSSVMGVLLMMPRSAADNTVPSFISAVGKAVLLGSLVAAFVAALAAILFSRTITRPLSRLNGAARSMAGGDYKVRVETEVPGELGELAHSFNEMAAQLNRDVEELHKQEEWRRELIMSVTHDLATPLTAIAGLGEALVDGVNQSREDYEETGRVIVRETLRLRRLVRDLHIMAKVEAGALYPVRKPIRLAALVDEVLAVLASEFERAQVEPNNTIPFSAPPIPVDTDMLTRVFTNLCSNAIRHTPPGGTVTIAAQQRGDTLMVAVTDTGEGIPPDALQRVFERFFRADSARRSSTGGSGLGLAIVKAMIEAHGGTIWAENAPGGGARFVFTLPLNPTKNDEIINAKTVQLT